MVRREARQFAGALLVVLGLVSGCSDRSPSGSSLFDAFDASVGAAQLPPRAASAPSDDGADAKTSLLAAYVAARQAEGKADARYHLAPVGDALGGHNFQNGFSASFDARGFELRHALDGWSARIDTRAVRCGDERIAVGAGRVRPVEGEPHRVSTTRAAGKVALEEWAVNGPLGVEQGFTFPSDPCGGRAAELVIEIGVEGLAPIARGDAVTLRDEVGVPRARYSDLRAVDARGASLAAKMGVADGVVELRVATEGASWPVVVDPMIATQQAVLTEDLGAASDLFGGSVSLSGTTALVGAFNKTVGANKAQGAAFVFVQSGTTWSLQQQLTASDGVANDQFGSYVALSGTNALVSSGSAVYAFTNSGTVWTQQASKLVTSDGALGGPLGVSGNLAILGGTHAAYVFSQSGSTWSQQAKLAAGIATDAFGASVAISGTTALVGAYGTTVGANASQGAAYVFVQSGTNWAQQGSMLTASSGGAASDWFGVSVALSGSTALVGAYNKTIGANSRQGAAYAFGRSGTTWTQQTLPSPADGAAGDNFGYSVGVSGTTAVIGAYHKSNNQGAAYVYVQSGITWSQQGSTLTANDATAGDYFGNSVAVSGSLALVGAFIKKVGANTSQGEAYIFAQSGSTWSPQPASGGLTESYGGASDDFGYSVAVSGTTAIVGAFHKTLGANANQGAAYVFDQSGSQWSLLQQITAGDGAAGDNFGKSVAVSGSTAVIGALNKTVGANGTQGAGYVFTRGGTGFWAQQPSTGPALIAADGAANDQFGAAVAVSGTSVLVGASNKSAGAGAAYLFVQNGASWSQQKTSVAGTSRFGGAVALSGSTAIVGAGATTINYTNQGTAYVYVQSGTSWNTTPQATLTPSDPAAPDGFGSAVALSGTTALIGASGKTIGTNTGQGAAYVFTQNGASWTQQGSKLVAADGTTSDRFGTSVALEGQTALIGASKALVALAPQGAAYVFVRSGSIWSQQLELAASPGAATDHFGYSVGLSGSAAVVGAWGAAVRGNSEQGLAYAFAISGAAGAPCLGDAFCATSYACTDGVCCTSACSGACDVCARSLGATVDGTCTPLAYQSTGTPTCTSNVLCDGVSGNCPTVCTSDALCPSGMYCTSAGTCVGKRVTGNSCDLNADCKVPGACAECASGNCADGACCDTPCTGACEACSASLKASHAASGTCGPVPAATPASPACSDASLLCNGTSQSCPAACTSDAACASGFFCDLVASPAKCTALLSTSNNACVRGAQCASGSCVDGYCCDAACGSLCQACSGAKTGRANGTCAPVAAGTDPDAECGQDAKSTCGHDGMCDGAVAPGCAYWSVGTSCGSAVCSSDRTQTLAQTCVGASSCQTAATGTTCAAYKCVPASGLCGASCSSESDCQSGFYCDASSACVAKLAQGAACSAASQCATGACADGYCCDAACAGACDACAAALKQTGAANGTCGPTKAGASGAPVCSGSVVCNGASAACPAGCTADAGCPTGSYCTSGGTCATQRVQGAACNLTSDCKTSGTCAECATGSCIDGVCCDTACGGACEACTGALKQSGTLDGTCGAAKSGTPGAPACASGALCDGASASCPGGCTGDASCPSGSYCATSGACLVRKAQGGSCNLANDCKVAGACAECASGYCVDGVCCDTACTGLCQACAGGLKTAGGDGVCGSAKAATDPRDQCAAEAQSTCGQSGSCNGSGACDTWATGTSCGNATCVGNESRPQQCTGARTCGTVSGSACGAYLCSTTSGTCATACASDGDCSSGNFCSGSRCIAKQAVGGSCGAAGQCAAGFCVDGYCCDTACGGTCEACSATKKGSGPNGTCGPVAASSDPDGECATEPQSTCGQNGNCDGNRACQVWPVGTSCAGSVCVGNESRPRTCAGALACAVSASGTSCGAFACSATTGACHTACATDGECAAGNFCSASSCVSKSDVGRACTASNQCALGSCVDGFCCDTACAGMCEACSGLKKGLGADGVCGAIEVNTDPDQECAAQTQSTCGTNGQCDGARACAYWAAGTSCGAPSCVGNETRSSVCTAPGTCGKSASGVSCGNYACGAATGLCATTCSSEADCASGSWCDGASHTCQSKQAAGAACTTTSQCVSGACVDGFCCDTACAGTCVACSALKKGGGSDGVCGAIGVHTDPDNECAQQSPSTCGTDGSCDGNGACSFWAVGTLCGSSAGTCNGNLLVGEVCQGAGVCAVSAGGVPCSPENCVGGACAPCSTAADCLTPATSYCAAGACLTKKGAGSACGAAAECGSGACTDGFCCDTACGGACEACSAQKKGQGKDGECGAVVSGSDPDGDCAEQPTSTCGHSGQCDGNRACAYWSVGTACASPVCVGNESRPSACAGALACAVSASGTSCGAFGCSASSGTCLTTCASGGDCQPGNYCDATSHCVGVQAPGKACASGAECSSGHCIDGYCCDTACGGLCEACSAVKKGAGADGVCGAVGAGKDPDDECATSATSSCGTSGTCDGVRGCGLYASGQVCGADLCLGGAEVRQVCDGVGLCGVTQDNAVACAPYQCSSGHCLVGCAADGDCVDGFFCQGGACSPKRDLGAACAADRECGLGHCADDRCCNEACTGQCEACNSVGGEGTCSVVTGSPLASRKSCGGVGVCQGTCNGGDRTTCTFPHQGQAVTEASCSGDSEVPPSKCDGNGEVQSFAPFPCGAYTCGPIGDGGLGCKTTCKSDTDCAGNLTCDIVKGTCSQGGKTCSVDGTSEVNPDGSNTDCRGFTCTPVTGCRTTCDVQSAPCARGYLCAQQKCVVASDDGGVPESATTAGSDTMNVDQSKGCGCRTVGSSGEAGGVASAAGFALLGIVVRRRRRR